MKKLLPVLLVIVALGKATKHHFSLLDQRQLYIRPRYFGLCKDNPPDTSMENVTITYQGKRFFISGVAHLYRSYNYSEKMIVHIRRCNDPAEEVNCEHFQTWTFGKDLCSTLSRKNAIWTPAFDAFSPRISTCPVAKGTYTLTNGTLDTEMLEHIFKGLPVERYFWRTRAEVYDYKLFTCIDYGMSILRGKA